MSFNIIPTERFEKELKRLVKKHLSLKADLIKLISTLKNNPSFGIPLGNNCYKIRLAISSKGKGKSGGARVITYVKIVEERIFLLSIYDKSESDTITDSEILSRVSGL
ncbi:type II toxin-antitoxin system RelE/ParE family toxin [Mucilaginibacter sp.]|uniref:type II toxin-antitoxin system RelE family toxin n=1 Tax=Mucilaginibacter sp. TaxID=1882438 RepID=UPI0035BBE853